MAPFEVVRGGRPDVVGGAAPALTPTAGLLASTGRAVLPNTLPSVVGQIHRVAIWSVDI
jgi:hypothetical protein